MDGKVGILLLVKSNRTNATKFHQEMLVNIAKFLNNRPILELNFLQTEFNYMMCEFPLAIDVDAQELKFLNRKE